MDDAGIRLDVDEHDTPAEVDAAFRTLRRVAVWHFVLFLAAVLGVPALSLGLGWWSGARIDGGMSPGFAMAAFGLYVFFLAVGLAAATLSSAVEARMLGGAHDDAAPEAGPEDAP
ncbi:hypothetical protein [Myceligenerans xiligouense]|uniref:Uncharacterized protein n=1 Tax=Myceligenerans xiligouense TaxID=253184 RepID=A0A3N4ZAE4_9MICO|nr:hypothetical protein [Myceligenerans xiligouense]RPF22392.1 hypothetical protein EDD34_3051 [Myceligenerans xiligouense]